MDQRQPSLGDPDGACKAVRGPEGFRFWGLRL